jgi:hypothetical protein
MKTSTKILLFAIFMGSCSLANAKSVEVWNCKLNDGKSFDDLMVVSSAWLAATKSMEGAEGIEAYHEYPAVANAGDGGFNFVVILPDLEVWGKLAKAYPGSASQKADEAWGEVATCKGNSLWASEKIK